MKKKTKYIVYALFAVYSLAMLWLLFLQRDPTYNYQLNLRPFRVIKRFIEILYEAEIPIHYHYSLTNLLGNIALFVPIGIFFPLIWRKHENPAVFFPTTLLLIIAVEAIQYFSCLGMGDVDDVILNMTGIAIGFLSYKMIKIIYIKRSARNTESLN